jgi:3-deoxy-D-manno-octulosonate 8-phosphate phosphatase (KDO 8-P phosphatase)
MPTPAHALPDHPPPAGRPDKLSAARGVRLLALDVDGVLTDGSINLDDHGVETKRFNVRDGQGIAAWLRLGLEVAVITRRAGRCIEHRCRELGIQRLVQASKDKSAALDQILSETGIAEAEVCYVGDDWPDLPVLRRVGLPVCPPAADGFVRRHCALVTATNGGEGAVREVVEHILRAKGRLDEAVGLYSGR